MSAPKMSRSMKLLRVAAVGALVALALMAWSLVDERPLPVLVAMSVGQLIGTLSLAGFILVVVADLRRHKMDRPVDSLRKLPDSPDSAPKLPES